MEKGHGQWAKHGVNFLIFVLLLAMNLFRGSKKNPSMFGIEQCSAEDWTSIGIFCFICIFLTHKSVKRMQYEQKLKIKYGEGLASSDIDLQGSNLVMLVGISLIGGWVSGALGLGGGSIFNPLLLSFGVPP